MSNLDPRIPRAVGGYLAAVVVLVVAAQLGVVPGAFERPSAEGPHVYRVVMTGCVLVLAVTLGALSAWIGRVSAAWHLGFGALVLGGMATGALLAFAPMILYPADQYPVTFGWLMLGAPTGFLTWLAGTVVARSGPPSAVAA